MSANHGINPADIRLSRFRLRHEDLSKGGAGCVAYHIPTKQSAMAEEHKTYLENKKAALATLAAQLGIKNWTDGALSRCKECNQEIIPSFDQWERIEIYQRKVDGYELAVYMVVDDDPDLSGWAWSVDGDTILDDAAEMTYETPEGAVRAAERWLQHNRESKDDSQEGDLSTVIVPSQS